MTSTVRLEQRATRLFLFGVDFFEVREALARERVGVTEHLDDVVVPDDRIETTAVLTLVVEVDRCVGAQFGERIPRCAVAEQLQIGQVDARR